MARDTRNELHIEGNFDLVDVAMAKRLLTSLITGGGAANACEVI